jgi:hypothetical protein
MLPPGCGPCTVAGAGGAERKWAQKLVDPWSLAAREGKAAPSPLGAKESRMTPTNLGGRPPQRDWQNAADPAGRLSLSLWGLCGATPRGG